MTALARRLEALPLWTPVASVVLALAWLIPNSTRPWLTFHKDFCAALAFMLVGAALALRWWQRRRDFELDGLAGVLAALGVLALAQWAIGLTYFFGHAAVGATYLVGAACAVVVGRAWEAEEEQAAGRWLFPAFFLGALGTTGLMLKQWFGIDGLDIWTHPMPAQLRPYGNMLQPNNAATLLLLGVVALFWLRWRGKIGWPVVLLGGAFFLFALVLTQSRIGFLNFLVLCALAGFLGPRLFGPGARRALGLLAGWFLLVLILLPELNQVGGLERVVAERGLVERADGGRWQAWQAFGLTALAHPLLGAGFLPGVKPQMLGVEAGLELPSFFTWAHNAFLDVAAWFGLPALLALLAVCGYGAWRLWRAPLATGPTLYAAALLVLGLHGMVELPLGYAFFLLPFCLLAGALGARLSLPAVRFDARMMAAVVALVSAAVAVIAHDYLEVERSVYTWRFKLSRVGLRHDLDLPNTVLLRQFRSLMVGVRVPNEALDADATRDFTYAVELEPSPVSLQKLVTHLVDQGDLAGARHWIEVARKTALPEHRRTLALYWKLRSAEDRKYAQVQWPE